MQAARGRRDPGRTVALTIEVVWREVLASGQPRSENLPAIAGGLVSVVFGGLFAFWLTRIIDQSYERRRLIEQLERLAGRVAEETGMAATATATGTPRPLSADAEVTLLRVTQEALANVTKHAGAGRVAVTLSYMDGEAAVDVRDDGAGFAPEADGHGPGGGLGLRGMRERVEALGGHPAVESAPGRGTTIAVTVPVS